MTPQFWRRRHGPRVVRDLPPLYHWAPAAVREQIISNGLMPNTPTEGILAVCLSPDAATAWALSGEMRPEVERWDLWQVHVADTPAYLVHHWGRVAEYRVPRTIAPQGLIRLAERTST